MIKLKVKSKKAGGYRPGSGCPKGTGKFREKTQPIRIPEGLMPQIHEMLDYYAKQSRATPAEKLTELPYHDNVIYPYMGKAQNIPLFSTRVAAGFPSPADDYIEAKLDLNEHLIKHPAATFFVRVTGDSMIGAGIHENDILVVDRSLKPVNGKVVIAVINGELTVKRLSMVGGKVALQAENDRYPTIHIDEVMDFSIWGVVTNVIHSV